MKKTSSPKPSTKAIKDRCAEYHFDYGKARPNRFAGKVDQAAVVVVLDPDVAEVFKTPESVNAVLRALIAAMPHSVKRKT
jgi:hypothetical protein